MRKFSKMLLSLNPLSSWRGGWWRQKHQETSLDAAKNSEELARDQVSRLTLPSLRLTPDDWQPVADSVLLRQTFSHFREFMYGCNRRTKQNLGEAPKALWETGTLAGNRLYFYLQPWSERGYLFEETARGWVVARAEKIALRDQFMRERSAWDHVVLYHAPGRQGLLRLMSEQMGGKIVSLAMYEDFMSQTFRVSPP